MKYHKPLVSVVIPTFNRADTIIRSINSILFQTYQNFEIIIVDDCSQDNTKEIISKNFNDNRIIYYRLPKNSGANAARNKGIELAKGDYIAFQDSDDEWLCEKLEKEVNILNSNKDCGAVFCKFIKQDNKNVCIMPKYSLQNSDLKELILFDNLISTQTLIIRKNILNKVGLFDESMPRFQDWDLAIRLMYNCNVLFLEEPLVIMHLQNNSITRNGLAGFKGLNAIVNKNYSLYQKYPKILSIHLRTLALEVLFNSEMNLSDKKYLVQTIESIYYNPYNWKSYFQLFYLLLPIPLRIKKNLYQIAIQKYAKLCFLLPHS